MKLSEKQKALVLAKLDKTWPKPRFCPVCKTDAWTVDEKLFSFPVLRIDQNSQGTTTEGYYPVILVRCQICSNTLSFSAIFLGVVDEIVKSLKAEGEGVKSE